VRTARAVYFSWRITQRSRRDPSRENTGTVSQARLVADFQPVNSAPSLRNYFGGPNFHQLGPINELVAANRAAQGGSSHPLSAFLIVHAITDLLRLERAGGLVLPASEAPVQRAILWRKRLLAKVHRRASNLTGAVRERATLSRAASRASRFDSRPSVPRLFPRPSILRRIAAR
jgi:hypothetical protein